MVKLWIIFEILEAGYVLGVWVLIADTDLMFAVFFGVSVAHPQTFSEEGEGKKQIFSEGPKDRRQTFPKEDEVGWQQQQLPPGVDLLPMAFLV